MHGWLMICYVAALVAYVPLFIWMCVWLPRRSVGPELIRAAIRHLPPYGRGIRLAEWFTARCPPDDYVLRSRERSGMLLCCDLRDDLSRLVFYRGVSDPETAKWICGWLRPGDTYVDVGAHIGSLISIAAQAVGPAGTIVGFEPHPRTYKLLKEAVHDSSRAVPRMMLYPAAVGEGRGTTPIYDRRSFTVTAEVPLVPLDAVIADQSIRLLRIDVEGFEEALRGGRRTLARCDAVLIDLDPTALARAPTGPEQVSTLLAAFGLRPADASEVSGRLAARIFLPVQEPHVAVPSQRAA